MCWQVAAQVRGQESTEWINDRFLAGRKALCDNQVKVVSKMSDWLHEFMDCIFSHLVCHPPDFAFGKLSVKFREGGGGCVYFCQLHSMVHINPQPQERFALKFKRNRLGRLPSFFLGCLPFFWRGRLPFFYFFFRLSSIFFARVSSIFVLFLRSSSI
jgi:hypothetical protein